MSIHAVDVPVAGVDATRWAWFVGALACAIFAALAATYPFMIRLGAHDLWARFLGLFTSADYAFGPHSSEAQHPYYRRAIGSFGLHAIAGSAALLMATTQFMPFVRHRWPVIHRAAGVAVVVLVAASMVGALLVQVSHPLAATLSGTGFGIGLMSLDGLALTELALAVLAVRVRDYRSHMGWMALMFASLLTAPVLRAQWLLLGFTNLRLDEANLIVAAYLIPQTVLLMACWMLTVGASDLGLNRSRSILPPVALRGLAVLAAMVAIHEGCLAPFGLDLIRAWRGPGHPLPAGAALWGLATALLALRVPGDLARLGQGDRVRAGTIACALAAAVGALVIGCTPAETGLEVLGQRSCFAAWGVEVVLLALFGRYAVFGRTASWDAQWLFLALTPALWPVLACFYLPLGVTGPTAMTTAMAVAYATVAVLGFASAFGLTVAVPIRRSPSVAIHAEHA